MSQRKTTLGQGFLLELFTSKNFKKGAYYNPQYKIEKLDISGIFHVGRSPMRIGSV
jgi:hypothetical protein